jgi:hypothetical protein
VQCVGAAAVYARREQCVVITRNSRHCIGIGSYREQGPAQGGS